MFAARALLCHVSCVESSHELASWEADDDRGSWRREDGGCRQQGRGRGSKLKLEAEGAHAAREVPLEE